MIDWLIDWFIYVSPGIDKKFSSQPQKNTVRSNILENKYISKMRGVCSEKSSSSPIIYWIFNKMVFHVPG